MFLFLFLSNHPQPGGWKISVWISVEKGTSIIALWQFGALILHQRSLKGRKLTRQFLFYMNVLVRINGKIKQKSVFGTARRKYHYLFCMHFSWYNSIKKCIIITALYEPKNIVQIKKKILNFKQPSLQIWALEMHYFLLVTILLHWYLKKIKRNIYGFALNYTTLGNTKYPLFITMN